MKKFSEQKSNLEVVAKATDPKASRRLKTECKRNGPPDEYGVVDLKKTNWEKQIIRRGIKIFQRIIKDLGMDIKFCPNLKYFHIISKKEMRRKLQEKNPTNGYFNCHAYLLRDHSPWYFVHGLFHELAHFVSYYKLQITLGDNGQLQYRRLINGFADNQNPRLDFNGFDEAVTEMLAIKARQLFASSKLLSANQKKALLTNIGYHLHVAFVEELLMQKTNNQEELMALKNKVFKAYILGQREQLFKKLRLDANTIAALKKMTTAKTATHRAIAFLGWPVIIV